MPNQDGTGPRGQGPKTGLGLGKCGNSDNTPAVRPCGRARGGRGAGAGRGAARDRRTA